MNAGDQSRMLVHIVPNDLTAAAYETVFGHAAGWFEVRAGADGEQPVPWGDPLIVDLDPNR
jgi:hypothetical protein